MGWSKLVSSVVILIEIYKVFFGSALVVFAPDMCEDHRCNPFENYARGDSVYQVGFWLNAATLVCFAGLYYVEMKREHKLTHYLRTNHAVPTENSYVAQSIQKLTEDRQTIIYRYNNLYKKIGYVTLTLFSVNTVLSGYIIFSEYLDDKSGVALITNTLFVGSKLYDIYGIVNTDKHVFLSAYVKNKAQFNDVQPNKMRLMEEMV